MSTEKVFPVRIVKIQIGIKIGNGDAPQNGFEGFQKTQRIKKGGFRLAAEKLRNG